MIVAGHGMVGSTVRRALEGSTADCTVVDVEDGEDVDVVGDVTDEATLVEAGVEGATVLVVAIGDDDEAILSVLLADELADETDIIVRTNDDDNGTKLRRAGADYVLSLPEMSGRVLAQAVLHEAVLSYGRQLKTVRIDADPFAGRALGTTPIPELDCVVVAVERDGEFLTDVSPEFGIRKGDSLVVVGSDDAIDEVTG